MRYRQIFLLVSWMGEAVINKVNHRTRIAIDYHHNPILTRPQTARLCGQAGCSQYRKCQQ